MLEKLLKFFVIINEILRAVIPGFYGEEQKAIKISVKRKIRGKYLRDCGDENLMRRLANY